MIDLNVVNETNTLKAVLLGIANNNGPVPLSLECYDPNSLYHVNEGSYPVESKMIEEISSLEAVFMNYGVEIYRPEILSNYNQIFARDIAFVVDDKIIKSNTLPERAKEFSAIKGVLNKISSENIIELPDDCHIEGGDVILHNDYIFIGVYNGPDYSNLKTARTNYFAVEVLKTIFPLKKIKALELKKSNINPKENALHLDCCFQPIGRGKALIHKQAFLNQSDYNFLKKFFGTENLFQINKDEMASMYCNIFSISENVIISDKRFERLNNWLTENGFFVESISFKEVSKLGGLFRCSTMPLKRS